MNRRAFAAPPSRGLPPTQYSASISALSESPGAAENSFHAAYVQRCREVHSDMEKQLEAGLVGVPPFRLRFTCSPAPSILTPFFRGGLRSQKHVQHCLPEVEQAHQGVRLLWMPFLVSGSLCCAVTAAWTRCWGASLQCGHMLPHRAVYSMPQDRLALLCTAQAGLQHQ